MTVHTLLTKSASVTKVGAANLLKESNHMLRPARNWLKNLAAKPEKKAESTI